MKNSWVQAFKTEVQYKQKSGYKLQVSPSLPSTSKLFLIPISKLTSDEWSCCLAWSVLGLWELSFGEGIQEQVQISAGVSWTQRGMKKWNSRGKHEKAACKKEQHALCGCLYLFEKRNHVLCWSAHRINKWLFGGNFILYCDFAHAPTRH